MTEALTPTRWQTAIIARTEWATPTIKRFWLQPATPFQHRAGQHVDVRLTAPDGYQAMRSYSIASAPAEGGLIELAIERLERGEVSPFFDDVAAVGDEIELRGPLGGHFVWSPADGGPLLLLGGGSGVVPLLAMARQRALLGSTVPMALLLSARTQGEALALDELRGLDAHHDGFAFRLALTREVPEQPNDYGRRIDAAMVTELLALLPAPPQRVYICGSNAFANTAADSTIAAGVPVEAIRTERYGG